MNKSKNEMRETVKQNLVMAKEFYKKNKELGLVMFIQQKKDKKKSLIPVFIHGEGAFDHRHDVVFDLGVRFGIMKFKKEINDVDGFYMISEVWIGDNKDVAPSQQTDKKEGIASVGLDKDGNMLSEIYEMKKKWVGDDVSVEFKKLVEFGDKPDKAGAPLLEMFWKGVKSMEKFDELLPAGLREPVASLNTDETFDLIMSQFNQIRKNNGQTKIIRRENPSRSSRKK